MSDDSSSEKPAAPGHDVVLIHGQTDDGAGLRAIRSRSGRLALTELRPVHEGRPIAPSAELVRLRKRAESPFLWDVEVLYGGENTAGHEGPPRVSSARYRENWEAIFGDHDPEESSLN